MSARTRSASARAAHAPVRRIGPWTVRDCRALAVVHVVALGVIVLSYWKSSGQAHPADQLTWLNLSVVAMMVAGGADAVFFARGHRTAAVVRRALFTAAPEASVEVSSERFVALAGARRFHLSDCSFVAGKSVSEGPRTQHDEAGRVPCEVCLPGGVN